MAEVRSPSTSSKPARETALELLRQHQDTHGHTHSGRPRVADPGPKAQVRARGDPDLAPEGSDQTRKVLFCSHAGSTREGTFEPPPRREDGRCSPGLFLAEPRCRLHDALGLPPPPSLAGAPPRTTSLRCSPPISSLRYDLHHAPAPTSELAPPVALGPCTSPETPHLCVKKGHRGAPPPPAVFVGRVRPPPPMPAAAAAGARRSMAFEC
jgi:hypothetical protein